MPHLKNVKNTHRAVILLKLQALACNFTKSISPPWVFFTFFNEVVPNRVKHDKYFMRAWEGIVKVAIFLKFPTILLTIIEKTWIRYFPCEKWRCVSQTRLPQFSKLLQMETKTLVFLFTNGYVAISFMKSRCQPTFLPSRISRLSKLMTIEKLCAIVFATFWTFLNKYNKRLAQRKSFVISQLSLQCVYTMGIQPQEIWFSNNNKEKTWRNQNPKRSIKELNIH